ncbi:hypothetical protein HUU39_21900 [candidate division KSB1 bacterium]|nr:hypothetical protein [bacterium]NUM67889.1 hypothetical protein [candidate division KSB1 bacterium]
MRQDFRTRKDRSLKTKTDIGWEYKITGKKQICVKIIDVFGVDTTTVVEVEVLKQKHSRKDAETQRALKARLLQQNDYKHNRNINLSLHNQRQPYLCFR